MPWRVLYSEMVPHRDRCINASAMFCEETRWSSGLLVEFDQHATGLDVAQLAGRLPNSDAVSADDTCATFSVPPSTFPHTGAVVSWQVVVAVLSGKHHSVGNILRMSCSHKSILGVSDVPVHRQLILTNLTTDGERRVLSPVPLTVSTLDLQKPT